MCGGPDLIGFLHDFFCCTIFYAYSGFIHILRCSDDFRDFCLRASELAERSNGAPLFTVTQSLNPTRSIRDPDSSLGGVGIHDSGMREPFDMENSIDSYGHVGEDDWQLL